MLPDVNVPAGSAIVPLILTFEPNTVNAPCTWIESVPVGGSTNIRVVAVGFMLYGVRIKEDLTVPVNSMEA
jgi:hypothetical protein